MSKIAIVGYGYVGKAMHKMLGDRVTHIYDPFLEEHSFIADKEGNPKIQINSYKEATKECDLTVVCVPTAMTENGSCDTSLVEEVIEWIESPLILIKSTVKPGTTDKLKEKTGKHICFSPEYIGEGKYFTPPWMYPDPENPISHGFMIIGGDKKDSADVADVFVRVMGPHTKFHFFDAKTAETVKYLENMWGAMKVTFMNEIYDCCEALGVNFHEVREGWAADPRVERMHSAVFKDARGFSGKCYPKDLSAFIEAVAETGYEPKLLKAVWNRNTEWHPEFKKK